MISLIAVSGVATRLLEAKAAMSLCVGNILVAGDWVWGQSSKLAGRSRAGAAIFTTIDSVTSSPCLVRQQARNNDALDLYIEYILSEARSIKFGKLSSFCDCSVLSKPNSRGPCQPAALCPP